MGWTKVASIFMLLIVIFSIGLFGAHFGYKVDGVPNGGHSGFHIIKPLSPGDANTLYAVYFNDGTSAVMSMAEIKDMVNSSGDIIGYLTDLASFQVDGCPTFLSLFFDILILVLLYLIVTSFTPFIPGG